MEPTLDLFKKSGLGSVRVVTRDSGFWFVAKDVAECIGHSDASRMCDMCRESDRYVVTKLESDELSDSNNHVCSLTLISEPGLYRIMAKCRLPKCEPFEKWVFEDVLPSIRKRGVYATPQAVESMSPEELMAKAVLAAQDTIARLQRERDEAVKAKSRISAGREATLMNRCGNQEKKIISLTKENAELKAENNELRMCEQGIMVRDIPWIKQFFVPNCRNGEYKVDVYNRIGTRLSILAKEMGVVVPKDNKVLDPTSKHMSNVWPRSLVDAFKARLDTLDPKDECVRAMAPYFRPSIQRQIKKEST